MLTNKQIETIVAQYDKMKAGHYASTLHLVTKRTDIGNGAELVKIATYINNPHVQKLITTTMIVYYTGDVFCTTDWEHSPQDYENIEDYDWVHANTGRPAIVLNGLPRLFI